MSTIGAYCHADLSVRRLSQPDFCTVIPVLENWGESAYKRFDEQEGVIDSSTSRKKLLERLRDCAAMSFVLYRDLLKMSTYWSGSTEIYGCVDSKGIWQGFMSVTIERDQVSINQLVSNPRNVFPQTAECGDLETLPVKGAGTVLVLSAISRAIESNKETVSLMSLPSARSFYAKLGFLLVSDQSSDVSMKITAEKIWDLYPHLIISGLVA